MRTVIYALGGGRGHLMRARTLARSRSAVILHQVAGEPGLCVRDDWSLADVQANLRALSGRDAMLIVDTFPGGIAHELDDSLLALYGERVLIRRYLRPGAYEDEESLAARFDRTLIPYREERCEWERRIAGEHVGPLVRALRLDESSEDLVVIGSRSTIPEGWMQLLIGARFIDGPFASLPRARRYLALAAGHNLTYELLQLGVPFALCPQERRYDDQYRRADRLGAGIFHRGDLECWLEAT
jgi:hypothetical protein